MKVFRLASLLGLIIGILSITSCNNDDIPDFGECPDEANLIYDYTDPNGIPVRVYENGAVYILDDGDCLLAGQYFVPGFFEATYIRTDSGVVFRVDDTTYLSVKRSYELDFEAIDNELDLFILDIDQTNRLFTNFTLQSPATPTVATYVDLQNCIINGSCDFVDNKFEFAQDPTDANNTTLKFFSVAPDASMVTAKTSINSTLLLFEKGDDFWFEAKYFIDGPLPTTLADFESSYFEGSVGPRIIFKDDQIAIENKFGEKLTYRQPSGSAVSFPTGQWVTLKVHLMYDESNGIIQVWQDDQLVIDSTGPNMPLDFWIQNRFEIGITATSAETTLYMDDVRFRDADFEN